MIVVQWEQRPGETIFKGHRSYDLMLNLQLGIRWSVSRNARDPLLKEMPSSVFSEKVTWRRCLNSLLLLLLLVLGAYNRAVGGSSP